MKPDIENLIDKYLQGKCSAEERKLVEAWYAQLDENDGLAATRWHARAKMLKSGIDKKIGVQQVKVKKLAVLYRVAAAVLLLILGGMAYLMLGKKVDTKQELLAYAGAEHIEISQLKETRLILNQQKSIDLNGNADIHYTQDELEIKSGKDKSSVQKLEADRHGYSTLVVPYGRRVDIALPDGTKVWLNSGSKLVYPNAFKGDKREVFLQGEAYFDVAHNAEKPFHVYAKDADVKVLGTSFNVRAYTDEQEVKTTLVQGRVMLSDLNNPEKFVHLVPGRMAIFSADKSFSLLNVDTEMYTSWKEGYLYLKNERLQNLLKTITRYYNIAITVDENQKTESYFSGRLTLEAKPEQVLNSIAFTIGYQAENTERGWVLKKKTD